MATWKHWLWLSTLQGVSLQLKHSLLDHFGDPEAIYYGQREEYLLAPGMTGAAADALADKDTSGADRILEDCARMGLQLLSLRDTAYPGRLRDISSAPLLLYVQGRMPLFDGEAALAMVGTRRASPYALEAGERLAGEIAGRGGLIVSGLAVGVAAAAHRGALRSGGFTAAVIAGGHDIPYPRENRRLYEDIAARGVILSEYPPGTEHMAAHFPQRNRIISGLSVGVIVVEAGLNSGTQITVDYALNQGRSIYAVPGSIFSPFSQGTFSLLKNVGVKPVATPEDVLDDLRPVHRQPPPSVQPQLFGGQPEAPPPGLDELEQRIWQALAGEKRHFNDLAAELAVSASELSAKLTMCELKGLVKRADGQYFSRRTTGL